MVGLIGNKVPNMRNLSTKTILIKVKKDYSAIAAKFDRSRGDRPWKEFEIFAKYLKQGDSILDLACGNGRLYDFLEKQKLGGRKLQFGYIGMDNAPKFIEIAKKNYQGANFTKG